jgi:hypothetical protein
VKRRYPIGLALLLSLWAVPSQAWDIRVGYHYLVPKLGTRSQDYQASDSRTLTYTPESEAFINGHSLSLGVGIDALSVVAERSVFSFTTKISETQQEAMGDTEARCTVEENRLGVYYHLERELAGVLVGGGLTMQRESVTTATDRWLYEGITPFGAFGFDIIFGSLRTRFQQTHYGIGQHTAKINSFGLLLYF